MTITDEIQPLSKKAIARLLRKRQERALGRGACRRKVDRWPFPGTAELWVVGESGLEQYRLATCENLSTTGAGIRSEDELPIGMDLEIAIHEPEVSFHGRAAVRHCTRSENGYYTVGVEFLF